jgi:hypothetical protein
MLLLLMMLLLLLMLLMLQLPLPMVLGGQRATRFVRPPHGSKGSALESRRGGHCAVAREAG